MMRTDFPAASIGDLVAQTGTIPTTAAGVTGSFVFTLGGSSLSGGGCSNRPGDVQRRQPQQHIDGRQQLERQRFGEQQSRADSERNAERDDLYDRSERQRTRDDDVHGFEEGHVLVHLLSQFADGGRDSGCEQRHHVGRLDHGADGRTVHGVGHRAETGRSTGLDRASIRKPEFWRKKISSVSTARTRRATSLAASTSPSFRRTK